MEFVGGPVARRLQQRVGYRLSPRRRTRLAGAHASSLAAGTHLAGVWLRDRALGTSAATFQHLEHEGKKLGHVLDPRTGWPAGGLASVSVVAPTAALADALSTAFYVGGLELARRYCESHPGVGAVVLPEGSREPVLIGLKAEESSEPRPRVHCSNAPYERLSDESAMREIRGGA